MPPRCVLNRTSLLLIALQLAGAFPLFSQTLRPEISAGISIPTGSLGMYRDAGPLARAGVVFGRPTSKVKLRLDAEGMWMNGSPNSSDGSSAFGDLTAGSVIASMLIGPARTSVAPYVLAGLASHWLAVDGVSDPYGTLFGGGVGMGMRGRVGRVDLRVESALHGIVSDFGTGRDFAMATYSPVTVGIRF